MNYSVIIPIMAVDVMRCKGDIPAVRYFVNKGVNTAIVLNGCSVEEAKRCDEFYKLFPSNFWLLYSGPKGNPYTARNFGMQWAASLGQTDAFILTDDDCVIEPSYLDVLKGISTRDNIVAGRVKTKVPKGISLHLDKLAAAGFECFDGFNPGGMPIGANMVIGIEAYNKLGQMRDHQASGGDCDYGIRAKDAGIPVIYSDALITHKVIRRYTYTTIVRKQVARATSAAAPLIGTEEQTRKDLAQAMRDHADALMAEPYQSPENYAKLVDSTFLTMWLMGCFARHMDERR